MAKAGFGEIEDSRKQNRLTALEQPFAANPPPILPLSILTFDTHRGRYAFEVDHLETDAHAHPVTERITALEGTFQLWLDGRWIAGLTDASVPANAIHRVIAREGRFRLDMEEQMLEDMHPSINDARVAVALQSVSTTPVLRHCCPASLAKAVGLSQSRLAHLFKAGTGCALGRHIAFE